MSKLRTPKFGMSAGLAILLAVYILIVPLYWVIGGVVVESIMHRQLDAEVLWWPLPCIFPVASLLMVADMIRGMATHQPVKSKLPVMAFCSLLLTIGSAVGLSSHSDFAIIPVIICCAVTVSFVVCSIRLPRRIHDRPVTEGPVDGGGALPGGRR